MAGWIGLLLMPVLAIAGWRVDASVGATWSAVVAGVLSLAAVIVPHALVVHQPQGAPRRLGVLAALAALTAGSGFSTVLWPCATSCSDGAAYATWLGLPLVGWASGLYALTALIASTQAHAQRLNGLARLLGWAAIGSSIYYLLLSGWLSMRCSHCLAVHTTVLTFGAALIPSDHLRWSARAAIGVIAALALHAGYHPWTTPALPTIVAGDLDATALRVVLQADDGRRFGRSDAPLSAELVLDPSCQHCREQFPLIRDALMPSVHRGDCQVVIRLLARNASGPSAAHDTLYAAAALRQLDEVIAAIMGIHSDATLEDLKQRLPSTLHESLELGQRYKSGLQLLAAADQQRLLSINARSGNTPHLVLMLAGQRTPVAQWSGDIPLDQIEPRVRQLVPQP